MRVRNEDKTMKSKVKNIAFLHVCILIYSLTSLTAKITSAYDFLSLKYIVGYAMMVFILGVYAIVWQQAIKPFPAAVAYSNKSVTTIWTLLFSAIFFGERITWNNIVGTILIIFGVVMVVRDVE